MKILILGGSGFIGFNLKRYFTGKNIAADSFSSKQFDIKDSVNLGKLVKNYDSIVNLVGLSGVTSTQNNPQETVRINTIGQLNLLEACRLNNPQAKIVFLSSRLEYGKTDKLPLGDTSILEPNTIYGISKYMATKYNELYYSLYGLKTVTLRVSNPFGPQPGTPNTGYNIINYFIYIAMKGKTISIFGKGSQKRDYIFVDDLCRAIHKALTSNQAIGKTINIGGGSPISIAHIAQKIIKTIGKGKIEYKSWPKEWSVYETGDSFFDLIPAKKYLDWKPVTKIDQGLIKTIKYFSKV